MSLVFLVVKSLIIIPLVLSYFIVSFVVAYAPSNAKATLHRLTTLASLYSSALLRILGVRVTIHGHDRLRTKKQGVLVAANHLSYVDILAIASVLPAVFITSVELRSAFLLGPLARMSGSLFVERRRAGGLRREINQIAGVLRDGFTVALFPESTTSNGDTVRPFKNSLFTAAIESRRNILPLCLRYTMINGSPASKINRDSLYYYGGMSFFRHVLRLLRLRSVEMEMSALKIIAVRPDHDRKELAARAHDAIRDAYHRTGRPGR